MSFNKQIFISVIFFSSITIGTKVAYSYDLKRCAHNEIIFDLIDAEADCFFDEKGDLNDKMQVHHKTGWLDTDKGPVYAPKIQLHGSYTKTQKDQDMHDPNCIPIEILLPSDEDYGN